MRKRFALLGIALLWVACKHKPEPYTGPEVAIGNLVWMKENLAVGHFQNGASIRHAQSVSDWTDASSKEEPAWCYVNNDPSTEATYGRLYNWFAVIDSRMLAPEGWHIPKDWEWNDLMNAAMALPEKGGALKATGTTLWNPPNTMASNALHFTGLPAGLRTQDGAYENLGKQAVWWSMIDLLSFGAYAFYLEHKDSSATLDLAISKGMGFSVRCVKD